MGEWSNGLPFLLPHSSRPSGWLVPWRGRRNGEGVGWIAKIIGRIRDLQGGDLHWGMGVGWKRGPAAACCFFCGPLNRCLPLHRRDGIIIAWAEVKEAEENGRQHSHHS